MSDYIDGKVDVVPWIKGCSKLGENCMSTKCCAYSGYSHFLKSGSWAGCARKCFPGKWNGGLNAQPMFQPGSLSSCAFWMLVVGQQQYPALILRGHLPQEREVIRQMQHP